MKGHLHLSYTLHPPPEYLAPLSLLRMYEQPLGIVGIASSSTNEDILTITNAFDMIVRKVNGVKLGGPFPQTCLIFEEEVALVSPEQLPLGFTVVPASGMIDSRVDYIAASVASLCSDILIGFADIVIFVAPSND